MVIYLPVTFEHCPLVHIILVAVTCPDLKHAAGALVIGSSLAQREGSNLDGDDEEFLLFLPARSCSSKFQGKGKKRILVLLTVLRG